jgi:hypothetical protein
VYAILENIYAWVAVVWSKDITIKLFDRVGSLAIEIYAYGL